MVNPSRITEEVGWNTEVRKNLQDAEASARKQIDARIAPSRTAFEQKKAEIFAAAKLTPQQISDINSRRITKGEMMKMGMSEQQVDDLLAAGTVWQSEVTNAQSALQQTMSRQTTAIQGMLNELLSPLIRQVAKDKGRAAVFMPTQGIWFDASLDITDDVIKEIQKRPSMKLTLPDMPKLEWSASQPAGGPTSMPSAATTMPGISAPATTQPAVAPKL
jgi:Skp family chaperone for outer membrane proteins